MQRTVIDCGTPALTSPCPPFREAPTTRGSVSVEPTPTDAPVVPAPSTNHHTSTGLSPGVVTAIIIGSIIVVGFLLFMLSPLSRWSRNRNLFVERGSDGIQLGRKRHIAKPSVSTVESGISSTHQPPNPPVQAPILNHSRHHDNNHGDNNEREVRRPEAIRIRYPSLPKARERNGDLWIRQAEGTHRHSDHALVVDDEDNGIWPPRIGGVGQGQVRDPVGLRPLPPVRGRKRGYRGFEATVEDADGDGLGG